MAAQLNPNMGVLPPELSTGSRFLDDELLRRARRQAGVANGQAAIQELKRQQWLTGQRTVADEMPGATAPEYAGAWQETQVGPSDNGVWTAPDGTRYAMRNGVPVGRSGAPAPGETVTERQNYLRDELLGQMRQPAPAPVAPAPTAPTPAPAPQVAQAPQAPRAPNRVVAQPPSNITAGSIKGGMVGTLLAVADDPTKGGVEAAFDMANRSNLLTQEDNTLVQAELTNATEQLQQEFEKASKAAAAAREGANKALLELQRPPVKPSPVAFTSPSGVIPSGVRGRLTGAKQAELVKEIESQREEAAKAEAKRVEIVQRMAQERAKILRKYLERITKK